MNRSPPTRALACAAPTLLGDLRAWLIGIAMADDPTKIRGSEGGERGRKAQERCTACKARASFHFDVRPRRRHGAIFNGRCLASIRQIAAPLLLWSGCT